MNFKPTKWKIIISIIAALIVILGTTTLFAGGNFLSNLVSGGIIGGFMYWIAVLIIVYVIWSLIQNKK
jgi:hypothetical protein